MSTGITAVSGNIDDKACKAQISSIIEGGPEAFERRKAGSQMTPKGRRATVTGFRQRSPWAPAHLTIEIQRLVQREPDLLLDEIGWNHAHWIVRSRHHARVNMDREEVCLSRGSSAQRLKQYAQACGEALALAHSRGDRRSARFEAGIVEALKDYSDELIAAAELYASQTVKNWQTLNRLHR